MEPVITTIVAAVALGLLMLVRPLAVAVSIWPDQLDLRGRTLIAFTAPRGIVAAAVASLSARALDAAGLAGGSEMEAMTYVAILVTGTIATIGAVVLPKVLGFTSDPARRRAVLVAELVHSEFGVEHPVVGLQQPPDELGRRSRAWVDLLGGRSADIPRWVRLLDNGTNESVELDVQEPDILARLREVEHHEPPEDEDGSDSAQVQRQ